MAKKERKPGKNLGKKFWILLGVCILAVILLAFFVLRPFLPSPAKQIPGHVTGDLF